MYFFFKVPTCKKKKNCETWKSKNMKKSPLVFGLEFLLYTSKKAFNIPLWRPWTGGPKLQFIPRFTKVQVQNCIFPKLNIGSSAALRKVGGKSPFSLFNLEINSFFTLYDRECGILALGTQMFLAHLLVFLLLFNWP